MPNRIPTDEQRATVDAILARMEASGLDSLSPAERGLIAATALGDPRSARLLPADLTAAKSRTELCAAIRVAWLDEDWHIVLDYRDRLRRVSVQVDDPNYPIASVILYATWFEHTLNAICIRQGLLRALDANQVDAMVRDASLEAKLDWLIHLLGLPAFEKSHRNRVIRLTNVRNQYVHYKWRGYLQADHEQQLHDLRGSVAEIDPTLDYFLSYYQTNLEEPWVQHALTTFGIDRHDLDASA
jgi:hypothetical protein